MDIRRLIVKCLALLAISGALVAAIVAIPNLDYLPAYATKMDRLMAPGPPRVIFIGGSGLFYGLDSKLAERSLGRPVVNLGLHAGVGLAFMLNHAAPSVRKGDIVVVVPEHGLLANNVAWEDHGVWTAIFFADFPRSARGFSLHETVALMEGFPDFAFHRLFVMPAIRLVRGTSAEPRFNSDGDEVGHLDAKDPGIKLRSPPVLREVKPGVDMLNDFAARIEAKGASVLYLFPALAASAFDEHASDIAFIKSELRRSLHFPFADVPNDGRMPDAMFFDTSYHPSGPGRRENTEGMVQAILSSGVVR